MCCRLIITYFICIFSFSFCATKDAQDTINNEILPGAYQTEQYLPLLRNKRVGVVVNHTSTIHNRHLVDSLLAAQVNISAIFSPEHGFLGKEADGAKIEDQMYENIPLYSLYGNNRKPADHQLEEVDIMVFDIQDVGARFYTYISTMHYAMEACAEQDIPFLVLDRPNPNGHYVDGPMLDTAYRTFVGMHPIPAVYGMTIGELAQMINGEMWLENGIQVNLQVIPCQNYDHTSYYELPINPSPNLPNMRAVLLYPSLCFLEGSTLSIGRGTTTQFQVIGHPALDNQPYEFTPISRPGATYPKWENETCYGVDLTDISTDSLFAIGEIDLSYLVHYYSELPKDQEFFRSHASFDRLAGSSELRNWLVDGLSAEQIKEQWHADIVSFKKSRSQYLLYADFE